MVRTVFRFGKDIQFEGAAHIQFLYLLLALDQFQLLYRVAGKQSSIDILIIPNAIVDG